MRKETDIIICVHNALEDVKKCIYSVQKNTECEYRLIIVDDGSQQETKEFLISISQKSSNILLIRNEEGHGYTVAVNMGIRNSTAQYVVLLNSDAEVTSGWLKKLLSAFEEDEKMGVVGPISNIASWQSVPRVMGMDGDWFHNELPNGVSLEKFSGLINKYIRHELIDVPLLNGFCMMVKRGVFDKIGVFDEKSFPKGYGEENDFNIRVGKAGFHLAVVSDCYIHHAQSKSYSDEERLKLCKDSDKELFAIHGASLIDSLVKQMRFNLEMQGVRARIKRVMEREHYIEKSRRLWKNRKLLILFVTDMMTEQGNVILQEAEKMIEMGVQVIFYNIYANRAGFLKSYPEVNIPIIYGLTKNDFVEYVRFFDAVSTIFNGMLQYVRRDKVEIGENCNRECVVIKPSVDIDFFYPKTKKKDGALRVLAKVKPSEERKSTEMTLRILQQIKEKYRQRVEIIILGFDADSNIELFGKDTFRFEYVDWWFLNREEIRRILQESDIFVDFSICQTMKAATMEAMACGCAVIAIQKSCQDVFFMNEHNSILVSSQNEEICKNALDRVLEDDRLRNEVSFYAAGDICAYYPEKSVYLFFKSIFGETADITSKKGGVCQEINVLQLNSIFPTALVQLILKCKDIYIYGAGNYAKNYANFIIEENIEIRGFVVTAYNDNPRTLLGKKVYLIENINDEVINKNYVGFIVAMMPQKGKNVADSLKRMGYRNIYIHGISN